MSIAGVSLFLIFLILPLLLACGTLIIIALKGKPAWSAPLCGKCKYDLRGKDPEQTPTCPECGADLSGPRAVLYMRGKGRRWGLAAWGIVLLLAPVLGVAGSIGAAYFLNRSHIGPGNYAGASNTALINTHLPARIDEPWCWRELESRLAAGTLSAAESEAAVRQLIAHMKATKPGGWRTPFHWQKDFLKKAHKAGHFSDAVATDLCDAFYGPAPTWYPFDRYRTDRGPVSFDLVWKCTWDDHGGLPALLVWDVTAIEIDGKPIKLAKDQFIFDRWNGRIDGGLPAGEHEVVAKVTAAYIEKSKLIGLDRHELPPRSWPTSVKKWNTDVKGTLRVYEPDETLVALSNDPALNPEPYIKINRVAVQPYQGKTKIMIDYKLD
ncbi:MAG: hypothetical protein GVY24_07425, partial [Planctomycetes bacterium]|nr:hypothetical protein [Planctomycetota bacterium]